MAFSTREIRADTRALACLILPLLILLAGARLAVAASLPDTLSEKRSFLYVTGESGIFDEYVAELVGKHAALVVIDTKESGPLGYSLKEIIARFKRAAPETPVIFYTWASRRHDGDHVGSTTLAGYDQLGNLLIQAPGGGVLTQQNGTLRFGDVTNPKFRNWHRDRVTEKAKALGANGVMLDVTRRSADSMFPAVCAANKDLCAKYPVGMDALFAEMRSGLAGGLLFYTGLWNLEAGQLEDQLRLLRNAHGAAIEFFGYVPFMKRENFEADVTAYFPAVESHPEKLFLFNGRGGWDYVDYEQDYLSQRYLYALYMMHAGKNTRFHYHSSFVMPPHRGRAGGLDFYADWRLPLGDPTGPATRDDELLLRQYSNALVLVLPKGAKQREYRLPATYYTPEGARVSGGLTLHPGDAHLLLKAALPRRAALQRDFGRGSVPASWGYLEAIGEKGRNYLRLKLTPEEEQWRHDLILDAERSLRPYSELRVTVRARDKSAKLLAVAEVNDMKKQFNTVVFSVEPGVDKIVPGRPVYQQTAGFRSPGSRKLLPQLPVPTQLQPDDQWATIALDGRALLEGSDRYTFSRWSYLRFIGNVDVEQIGLSNAAQ